jgi:hypothetical protein
MALPNTYVCICGQPLVASGAYPAVDADMALFALALFTHPACAELPLEDLKRRKTDGARMLDAALCKSVITLDPAGSVCLKRWDGFVLCPETAVL